MWIKVWLLASLFCVAINALPNGAPTDACENLLPNVTTHGAPQTSGTSPYSITTDAVENKYMMDPIAITLTGDNMQLKGIICQVRKSNGIPIGTFSVPTAKQSMYKTMMCETDDDTVTHMNRDEKGMEATFMWMPPEGDMGMLKVVCSFVKETKTHWHMVAAASMLEYDMESAHSEDSSEESSEENGTASIYGYGPLSICLVLIGMVVPGIGSY